jgi:hypothetical protein
MPEDTKDTAAEAAKTAAAEATETAKAAASKAAETTKATAAKASESTKAGAAKATDEAKVAAGKAGEPAKSAATRVKSAASAAAPTSAKDAVDKAKGAAYTVVGLGVMGLSKAQASARQLASSVTSKDLAEHVTSLKGHAEHVAKATGETAAKAEKHVEATITKVEEHMEPYEQKLPAQARDLVKKAHETGRETRAKVRAKVFSS